MYYKYTRRLGTQHFAETGQNKTLCGVAMLGPNYKDTDIILSSVCPYCAAIMMRRLNQKEKP